MKNGQAKNKTIIEEKERKKKEKEREKRIKEKKQETLKDEFDLETETVLQMTNRNRIKKEGCGSRCKNGLNRNLTQSIQFPAGRFPSFSSVPYAGYRLSAHRISER